MKRLLSFTRGYRIEAILGPLFKLLEATLELIVPLIIANIIDNGITAVQNGDISQAAGRQEIIIQCLWLLALGFIGLVFSVTAQFFCARCAVGTVTKMRGALFDHLGTLSYNEIDRLGTSTMITRMTSDANQVQTGVNLALRLLLRSPFVVFGAMIMACTIDVGAMGLFGMTIFALSVVVFGIMLISMPLYKKVQARVDGVVGKTRENLSGARVIRAFCKEDDEKSIFDKKNESLTSTQKFVGKISALMNPLTYAIINVAIVILIYTGAINVANGDLSAGQVVALYNYMSQILVELIKLANLIITMTKAAASASRISSVFDIESSMKEGYSERGADSEYAVELSDATLSYHGASQPAVEGISIKVKKGETVGIIGGTGSGKTSLVNLIPRFYDATVGSVKIDGIDVKDYTTATLRKKIAVVPQKSVLFAGSIRDNMRIGNADASDEQIMSAIDIAQAGDVVAEKGGLDAHIEQGGRNLSGGQKQRLTIARAIAANPEILILDDSASALDYATDAALRMAIKSMQKNTTVFIVSQRASSIMHADKIIVLDDGRADAIGTHEQLMESCAVYREIYASQFCGEV